MDRTLRTRLVLGLLGAALLTAAGCQEAPETQAKEPPAAPASGVPTPGPKEEASIAIADVPAQAERFETLRREVLATIEPSAELANLNTQLDRAERRAKRMLERPALSTTEEIQLVELQDIDLELRDLDADTARVGTQLEARARALETDLTKLAEEQKRWSATLPETRTQEAPEAIQARVVEITASIATLRMEVKSRSDEALTQLDRISRLRSQLDVARSEMSDRRRNAQRRLFTISEAPIWKMAFAGRPIGRAARERLARDLRRLQFYWAENGARFLAQFLTFVAIGLVLLFLLRGAAKECAKIDPHARAPVRVIERPLAAATLAALVIRAWTGGARAVPALLRDAVWTLAILSTALLLSKLLGRGVRRTLWILTAASFLYPFRYLFEQDPLLDRLVLIVQVVVVGATLTADLRSGAWKTVLAGRWQKAVTLLILVSTVLLAGTLLLIVIGYVEPARLLRTGVIGSLDVGLMSIGIYSLLYGLLSTLLVTRPARALRVVADRGDRVRQFLRRALATLLAIQWAFWSLASFGLGGSVIDGIQKFLGASIRVGSASIPVSGVLTFFAVLVASYLLAAVVRFALDVEILPRLKLPRGVPFTISTTARYAILVTGALLAFSAADINLSRVTLLAGALGVGLGFGLQNLVSNFVSGLILLFERPIQVGDYIDVGSLVGEVTRIGMRSSTILTAEGAEVVVPNADLISKSVVNWTLSDRRRRIEIRVGVAYGTDPERVIGLLLQAAADHPEALPTPAAAAFFVGFGESSLDFILQVWVARYEQAMALQSAVRRAVHRVLRENGIEIPFPTRDLNVRSIAPDAAKALSAETEKEERPARV